MNDPDYILAQKILSGDKKAFEEVYMRYYYKIVYYSEQYLSDREEARNIAQETFMELWRMRESVNPLLSLQSYLFTIARNKCLNGLRSRISLRKYMDHIAQKKAEANYEALADSSAEALIAAEIADRIKILLDEMPLKTKEAFVLSRYEELSYAEIAEIMGTSVKMVEYRIMQALKYLRNNLKEYLSNS